MKIRPLRFWGWPWELHKNGILGINSRNLNYLFELNPRSLYRLVDDKTVTKKLCKEQGIPVPETYAIIERFGDLRKLPEIIGERQEFVVKPAGGSGGRGVLVIAGRNGNMFRIFKEGVLSLVELRYHISTTLSGLYSLGGQPDHVILEERIEPHPVFENLAVGGTPDIRIITFRGHSVIAMLRLPTRASRGRANLHQGAAAAGIDMGTGRTIGGVCRNRVIDVHPDTGALISGLAIPYWDKMLEISSKLSEVIRLGYAGIDFVVDINRGPVVLEVNARPGLSVQIANKSGLLPMLERLENALSN